MPTSSVDTLMACSIMIILVLSAMFSLSTVSRPYLSDFSSESRFERLQQFAKYILLNPGTPANWGSVPEVIPNSFGLALANSTNPYELDIDKVSRLNSGNVYSITYSQLWESLGTSDTTLRIEIRTLFDLSLSLASSLKGESQTTYNFSIYTKRSGLPVPVQLHCYVVVKNYTYAVTSSTPSTGEGSLTVTLPNSANGAALLIVFAEAESQITTFCVYPFNHNSSTPKPNGTFMRLSPLNYTLNASILFPQEEVLTAQVFTYRYISNLTKIADFSQTMLYRIPRILDPSPMVLLITGFNGSSSFAEWVAYPQLPIAMGPDLGALNMMSDVVSVTYIVSINHVLYRVTIKCAGLVFTNV